jgi:hypothetical protein
MHHRTSQSDHVSPSHIQVVDIINIPFIVLQIALAKVEALSLSLGIWEMDPFVVPRVGRAVVLTVGCGGFPSSLQSLSSWSSHSLLIIIKRLVD